MSLTGFIRRPDRAALGSDEEVKRQISTHFPGVNFTFQAEEPPAMRDMRQRLNLSDDSPWSVPYPRHFGDIRSPSGWVIEFEFVAGPSVPWISSTAYGKTAGLDETFERMEKATGWETYYPS